MKTLEKIVWTEGLLLAPQHFQQWDFLQEVRHQQQYSYLHPLAWGIVELVVDEEALVNGKFRVVSCESIYPNGIFIRFDVGNNFELSIYLSH